MVDGHLRIELALDRHEPAIPVTFVELTKAEERLVLASLDPIAAMADAEGAALEALLSDLEPAIADFRAFLDELARQQGVESIRAGLVDPDEAPDLPVEPTVRAGELYALGDHRLLCGDATESGSVRRAFGEATHADLIWTDPPYGVAYQTKLSTEEAVARHRRTDGLEVANDQPEDIPALLAATFGLAPLKAGGAFYVASPSRGDVLPAFYSALAESGMAVRQQLIWLRTCSSWAGTTFTTGMSRSSTDGGGLTASMADATKTPCGRSRGRDARRVTPR